jgi:hypothetical protein
MRPQKITFGDMREMGVRKGATITTSSPLSEGYLQLHPHSGEGTQDSREVWELLTARKRPVDARPVQPGFPRELSDIKLANGLAF